MEIKNSFLLGLLSLAIFLSVFLYPFSNLFSIFLYLGFGSDYSVFFSSFKYLTSFSIFLLFYFLSRGQMRQKLFFLFSVFYWIVVFLLESVLSFGDFIIFILVFLVLFLVFSSHVFFVKKSYIYFNLYFLFFICFLVVSFGYYESFFVDDSFIQDISYFSLLQESKGIAGDFNPVPDNLFTMSLDSDNTRRMISFVGDPLYLSYFLFPFVFIFYVAFFYSKNFFYFFMFILLLFSLYLTYSRMALFSFVFSVFVFHFMASTLALKLKLKLAFYFSIVFFVFSVFYIFNKYSSDVSIMGHVESIIIALEHVGFGFFVPTFSTILSNFLSLKYDSIIGVESAALMLVSYLGVFSFWYFYYVFKGVFYSYERSILFVCKKDKTLVDIFKISYPFIVVGYLFTSLMSPQILTMQTLFFILGLSFLHKVECS